MTSTKVCMISSYFSYTFVWFSLEEEDGWCVEVLQFVESVL